MTLESEADLKPRTEVAAAPSAPPQVSIRFAGNVITQPFARLKGAVSAFATATVTHADFNQVFQTLTEASNADILIVHLDHQWFFDLVPNDATLERVQELQRLCEQWLGANRGTIFLNTLSFLPRSPVAAERSKQARLIAEANAMLFVFAESEPRVSILDLQTLLASLGHETAIRERNRYVMRFPYTPQATSRIVDGYAELLRNIRLARRKAVIVDADNTLWNGVVGEVGCEGIGVDDEFPNIIHKNLQRQLLELKRLGYLICVVTKNNESDFLEVFSKRSMPLSLDDLITYRSNWLEKSENLRSIAEELNIGVDALVFIDDNPFEIEEVRSRLPDVDCHLFPRDNPERALDLLDRIESLSTRALMSEDLVKTEQYRAEARRKQAATSATSIEDYLKSLDITLSVSVNDGAHVPRIAQLTNKTNQFNLTTKRYSEADIAAFMREGRVYDFRVGDRFGDMGIVGVAIVLNGTIDTFLMSCRALGRRLESEMLRLVTEDANEPLEATYVRSARNAMTADFYEQNGFEVVQESAELKQYRQAKPIQPMEYVTVVAN